MHNHVSKAHDEFRVRYTLLLLVGPLLIQVYEIIKAPERPDLTLLFMLILVIYCIALALFLIIATAINLYRLRWKRMLSLLLAPVLVGSLLWAEFRAGFTPDYVHFLLVRSAYLDQIRQADNDEPLFHAWLWERVWGVGVTATQTILIYDETDQIMFPPATRPADWIKRVSRFDETGNLYLGEIYEPILHTKTYRVPSIKKLADHFYLLEMAL